MHGGAVGSGGQAGNQNAYKHGQFTQAVREVDREGKEALRHLRTLLKSLRD